MRTLLRLASGSPAQEAKVSIPVEKLAVALLTGGFDKPYALGLSVALASKDIRLDVIGSDEIDSPEMHTPGVNFLNLRGDQRRGVRVASKVLRVLTLYSRLLRYAATAKPKIFHILWNNRLQFFDRTLLMLYYRVCRKKVVLTAHNVNAAKRDSRDSFLNRLTLKIQYRLANHIFVHTEKMKAELLESFGISQRTVTVIPFGINNAVPDTTLTATEAKRRLGIGQSERTILFFGKIGPYKGLHHLTTAFQRLAAGDRRYRLIIAGEPRGGCEKYLNDIQEEINRDMSRDQVISKIEYVPDEDTELYFKASDILLLPYTQIFQSGVLFLGYSFGLPVIASDVGSFRDDIVEGKTGFLAPSPDPKDLANTIVKYFESNLFKDLNNRRQEIRDYALARHSWDVVAEMTRDVYTALLNGTSS